MSTPKNSLANKSKAWSGRFAEPVAALVQAYTSSLHFDQRLALVDIAGSLAHAEMLAIRAACAALGSERLGGFTLTVTLEPCAMCAAAIAAARLERVVYGASDPKSGGVEHGARVFSHPQAHHRPEVLAGVAEAESAALLKDFFAGRR